MAHVRGRQPIGIDQPEGGTDYPLVSPPASVANLLADFYLAYPDDTCEFVLPLKITRLAGFGSEAGTGGWATHAYDVEISDQADAVVFDSTTASEYRTSTWDGRLVIVEWMSDTIVCRLVAHTEWTAEDIRDGLSRDYSSDFNPNVVLDARTYERMPLRVLTVNSIAANGLQLIGGYNVALSLQNTSADTAADVQDAAADLRAEGVRVTTPGKRFTNQIQLDCAPGLGEGQAPGCTDPEPDLKSLGGATPDSGGRILMKASGNLRIQRLVALSSSTPRQFDYGSDDAKASLVYANDGATCCKCSYYSRTYAGLSRQWDSWYQMAKDALDVRSLYEQNRRRWYLVKSQVETNPLAGTVRAIGDSKIYCGCTFCNTTGCCLTDVRLRFSFAVTSGMAVFPTSICAGKLAGTHTCQAETDITDELTPHTGYYDILFPTLDSQAVARVAFRLLLSNVVGTVTMTPYATVHYSSSGCHYPVTVPAEVSGGWSDPVDPAYDVHAYVQLSDVTLDTTSAYRPCSLI